MIQSKNCEIRNALLLKEISVRKFERWEFPGNSVLNNIKFEKIFESPDSESEANKIGIRHEKILLKQLRFRWI